MKKVIFLIISSHDQPVYKTMRDVSRLCFKKMESEYELKHFYVEHDMNHFLHMPHDKEIDLVDDTIYVKGIEQLNTVLTKTHKALKYINEHYDYHILVRTNLSSFWNIKHLYEIIESLDKTNIATGIPMDFGPGFISGTGIILSKDVCVKLCDILNCDAAYEDVAISEHLKTFITLQRLQGDKWLLVTDEEYYNLNKEIPYDPSNILYFRVKSASNRKRDALMFKTLAKKIYGIKCDNL